MKTSIEKDPRGLLKGPRGSSERILIFNVNWLGDVVFSTPFIRTIKKNFPDSHIACIVPARCRQVLEANPNVNEIIEFDERDAHRSLISKWRFANLLKRKKFDMVFLLHRSFTRALIARLANIPERIGYLNRKRAFLLTKNIGPQAGAVHRAQYFLNLARLCGLAVEGGPCDFFVTEHDEEWAEGFLKGAGINEADRLVILNPGGNWMPKRWPKENFAQLADRLIEELGVKVLITGAEKDEGLANEISGMMKSSPVIACGRTTLRQYAALAKRANLVISNDSGPLHIAFAVKRGNVIGLYGPTSPEITGPWPMMEAKPPISTDRRLSLHHKDVGCKIPCYESSCVDYKCMEAITVSEVYEAAANNLK